MKKLKIVAFVLLLVIMILNISCVPVFAASDSPITDPDFWTPDTSSDDTLSEKIGVILGVIQTIGVVVSVIVLMVLGIKYMVGSVEEKAINKKAMIPYLVGVFMVFSITTIPNFVYQFTTSVFPKEHEHTWGSIQYRSIANTKHQEYHVCQYCGVEEITGSENCEFRPGTLAVDGTIKQTCKKCGFLKITIPNLN